MIIHGVRKIEDFIRVFERGTLFDLRESGAIEQDADMVIFIYRDEYYNKSATKGIGNLIIAKYRDGYTGEVDFAYNESMTKIFDFDFRWQSRQSQNVQLKNFHKPKKEQDDIEMPF